MTVNFRTCQYFLTLCEMGTFHAAARKLYISQQSLSEHIRKLEKELDVQLFHRDNPLTLTDGGRIFYRGATEIMATLERMNTEFDALKGQMPDTLVIGCVDYGTPDYLSSLADLFFRKVPNVLLQTKELLPREPIPPDIPLLISARELGGYKCEHLFSDRPVVCVSDALLQELYGDAWTERRERLRSGELSAIRECPFIQIRNTPLESVSEMVFEANDFHPPLLPVSGSYQALTQLCLNGKCAMINFLELSKNTPGFPPTYPIPNIPETIPASFICYRTDTVLSDPAKRFLEITRQYFKRRSAK